jgi:hypothetical protein
MISTSTVRQASAADRDRALDRAALGPVRLETPTPSNLPFYERLGFAVRHSTTLPGGPKVWTMWREPVVKA